MFTYGIFKNPDTCKRAFGREVEYIEEEDWVKGYEITPISQNSASGILIADPEPESVAKGKVFGLSKKELAIVDRIEGITYKRIDVRTKKGHGAIMYIRNVNTIN